MGVEGGAYRFIEGRLTGNKGRALIPVLQQHDCERTPPFLLPGGSVFWKFGSVSNNKKEELSSPQHDTQVISCS